MLSTVWLCLLLPIGVSALTTALCCTRNKRSRPHSKPKSRPITPDSRTITEKAMNEPRSTSNHSNYKRDERRGSPISESERSRGRSRSWYQRKQDRKNDKGRKSRRHASSGRPHKERSEHRKPSRRTHEDEDKFEVEESYRARSPFADNRDRRTARPAHTAKAIEERSDREESWRRDRKERHKRRKRSAHRSRRKGSRHRSDHRYREEDSEQSGGYDRSDREQSPPRHGSRRKASGTRRSSPIEKLRKPHRREDPQSLAKIAKIKQGMAANKKDAGYKTFANVQETLDESMGHDKDDRTQQNQTEINRSQVDPAAATVDTQSQKMQIL